MIRELLLTEAYAFTPERAALDLACQLRRIVRKERSNAAKLGWIKRGRG
jgi:hypothetical protein